MGDSNRTTTNGGSLVISGNQATLFGLIRSSQPDPRDDTVTAPPAATRTRSAAGSARRPTLTWTAVPTLTAARR